MSTEEKAKTWQDIKDEALQLLVTHNVFSEKSLDVMNHYELFNLHSYTDLINDLLTDIGFEIVSINNKYDDEGEYLMKTIDT